MPPCLSVFTGNHLPRGLSRCRRSPSIGAVLLLILAGGLVGCGVAPGNGTTATSTKTVAVGCPNGSGSGAGVAAPALVLTVKDASHESKVHVGDVIQVRLAATQRWRMGKGGDGTLALLQPAGYWDETARACVWNFRAQQAGMATVSFEGTAICEPGQLCPQYVVDEEFPITVL